MGDRAIAHGSSLRREASECRTDYCAAQERSQGPPGGVYVTNRFSRRPMNIDGASLPVHPSTLDVCSQVPQKLCCPTLKARVSRNWSQSPFEPARTDEVSQDFGEKRSHNRSRFGSPKVGARPPIVRCNSAYHVPGPAGKRTRRERVTSSRTYSNGTANAWNCSLIGLWPLSTTRWRHGSSL